MSEKEEIPFEIGDVVRLKSGGPKMAITALMPDRMISTTWFSGDSICAGAFDGLILEKDINKEPFPYQVQGSFLFDPSKEELDDIGKKGVEAGQNVYEVKTEDDAVRFMSALKGESTPSTSAQPKEEKEAPTKSESDILGDPCIGDWYWVKTEFKVFGKPEVMRCKVVDIRGDKSLVLESENLEHLFHKQAGEVFMSANEALRGRAYKKGDIVDVSFEVVGMEGELLVVVLSNGTLKQALGRKYARLLFPVKDE